MNKLKVAMAAIRQAAEEAGTLEDLKAAIVSATVTITIN